MPTGGGMLPMGGAADVIEQLVRENRISVEMSLRLLRISDNRCSTWTSRYSREALGLGFGTFRRGSDPNAVLVGGGIGHLAAWLFDAWATGEENPPSSFKIVEEGVSLG